MGSLAAPLRFIGGTVGAAVSATALHAVGRGFKSLTVHHFSYHLITMSPSTQISPPDSSFETSILDGLHALEAAITAGRPPAPNPALRSVLARLDELTAAMPQKTTADLRHYLQKRSYQKARILLEGGDPEASSLPAETGS